MTADKDPSSDITSKALNVTRVGGLASLIAAVAAAAGLVFPDPKSTDDVALRLGIPIIRGAIIVAALFSVAIMIAADIRARGLAAATSNAAGDKKVAEDEKAAEDKKAEDKKAYARSARTALQDFVLEDALDPASYEALAARMKSLTPPTGFELDHEFLVAGLDGLAEEASRAIGQGAGTTDARKLLEKHLAEFNQDAVRRLKALG